MKENVNFKLGDRVQVPELGVKGVVLSLDPDGNPTTINSEGKVIEVIGYVVKRLPLIVRLLQALWDLITFK